MQRQILDDVLNVHDLFERYQCVFGANHSTETTLVRVINKHRSNMGVRKISILVLLDLRAAFDTVDHSVLLDRLHHLIGLSAPVFNCSKSDLTNRAFDVSMDECSSRRRIVLITIITKLSCRCADEEQTESTHYTNFIGSAVASCLLHN